MPRNLSQFFPLYKFCTFQELKKCFDAQDIPMLQETINKMPEQEAVYYMKRCVDAGLWVQGKNDDESSAPGQWTRGKDDEEPSAEPSAETVPSTTENASIDNVD